jgi:hypothetical protein
VPGSWAAEGDDSIGLVVNSDATAESAPATPGLHSCGG